MIKWIILNITKDYRVNSCKQVYANKCILIRRLDNKDRERKILIDLIDFTNGHWKKNTKDYREQGKAKKDNGQEEVN